jgi:Fe-S cluster assembly iron-binding protein IscA
VSAAIVLKSSGCCDPSLQLTFDQAGPDDLAWEMGGLSFVMDRSTAQMTGEVSLALTMVEGGAGLVMTSARPLTE